MPNFDLIKPSDESFQPLKKPITVVNRYIAKQSIVAKHSHNWGQFVYSKKGVIVVKTCTDKYIIQPEQGMWLISNTLHEVMALSDVTLTSLYINNEISQQLSVACKILEVNEFLKCLMKEASTIPSNYYWQSSDGRLLRLIVDRLSLASEVRLNLPYPKDGRLTKLLGKMQESPSDRKSLNEWGKIIGASSRTISRLFKQETGLNYSEWRARFLIQTAISRLVLGDSITSISLFLGYDSTAAFTYMFKEKTGVTPKKYLATIKS